MTIGPDQMNVGLTSLFMIGEYYKRRLNTLTSSQITAYNEECKSLQGMSKVAEKLGFRARIVALAPRQLFKDARLPCILQLSEGRPVILLPSIGGKFSRKVKYRDPLGKEVVQDKNEFLRQWLDPTASGKVGRGLVLLLSPMPRFLKRANGDGVVLSWGLIFEYFRNNRRQLVQLVLTLAITSFLTLVFPFLTQSMVDAGINNKDLNYITIILAAQLMLVFSRTIVDFIRSHLLLYVSSVVNLSLLSDFWIKLTRLPISYFDRGRSGEILQRISDNKQIQNFFTGPAINTVFAVLNFVVFAFVLTTYKAILFFVFVAGVILYFLWMMIFLKVRRKINYQIFHVSSRENNATLQLIQGMQEVKLLNVEQSKRWEWESIQSELFKLNYKNLSIAQFQQAGAICINQGKDIVLTFLVANMVVRGQLTFGALLAIQYIIGQLTGPVEQFIRFVQDAQNAKISMERLNEVHRMENEDVKEDTSVHTLPETGTIRIEDLSFTYPGENNKQVLCDIRLEIPEGKTTAIVGVSGSGKTTLLKILLKFYGNYKGSVQIGDTDLNDLNHTFWRRNCAVVFQDGYVFNDTIEKNISVEFGEVDKERLKEACEMANILTFIESLPDGFKTRLGVGGTSISQGQKQRLLIARAVYKNPKYVFFDESTNALDANTEMAIVENLKVFFKDRTVVVVAHRLSTVKNADKIVVLDSGGIMEQGSHYELSGRKGKYFELVRNQLELGN